MQSDTFLVHPEILELSAITHWLCEMQTISILGNSSTLQGAGICRSGLPPPRGKGALADQGRVRPCQ